MANVPQLSTLVEAARNIVLRARRQDDLGSLTVKTVRRQVERDFSLEEGTLDEGDIKTALRNAVNTALCEDLDTKVAEKRKRSPAQSSEQEDERPKKVKKKEEKREMKGKADEEEGDGINEKKKKKKSRVVAKSREILSDSEDGDDAPAPGTTASSSKTKQETKDVPIRSARKTAHKPSKFVKEESRNTEKSESDIPVRTDEPPQKKRSKGKTKEDTKKTTTRKSKKEKDPENALSPDEETVKKLKSFVSACGVRKQWLKEFADLPLPGQQITRLKEILADLGMTGRHSLEQAKAIKKKRDLARELNDVVEFERKAGASRKRSRPQSNAKRIVAELDTNSEVSESEDEPESSADKKAASSASKSIMAYLANQSGDEE